MVLTRDLIEVPDVVKIRLPVRICRHGFWPRTSYGVTVYVLPFDSHLLHRLQTYR
jgi:hypothetical protein